MLKKTLSSKETRESILFLFLIVLTGYLFSFGLNGFFLLDDQKNIGAAIVDSFNLSELVQIASSNTSGILGRPISVLSFSLTSLAHGSYIWGFKYHNILIHLLTGIAIYCLARRLLKVFAKQEGYGSYTALLATTIWLIHPLQVSTVMYAVQRMTQLSALFSFIAILVFMHAIQSPNNKVKLFCYFTLFPLALLLSVFSKENGVLTPLFVALIAVAIQFSTATAALQIKERFKTNLYDKVFLLLFVLLPIGLGIVGFTVKFDSFTDYSGRSFTLGQRLLSQIDFIFLYINQLLFPRLSSMGLFFDDIPIPSSMTYLRSAKLVVLAGLLIGGLISLIRGKSILGIGILFYFCGHLLESTIIPLELAFEHRNYLPAFGVFLIIAYYTTEVSRRFMPTSLVMAIWLAMLLTLLLIRLDYWSDETEWRKTLLAYHPNSERTRLEYIDNLSKTQDNRAVLEQIDEARNLLPGRLSFHIQRLVNDCDNTNPEENLKVIQTISNHLESKPLTTIGFNNLGLLVNTALQKNCGSIGGVQVYIFVGIALERLSNINPSANNYGFLCALKAKMDVFLGNHEDAYEFYIKGFNITGNVDFVFWAIQSLLLTEETRAKGLAEVAALENNKYFFSPRYKHRIDKLKTQIAENNFQFAF